MSTNIFEAPAQAGRDASNVAQEQQNRELIKNAWYAKILEAAACESVHSAIRQTIPSKFDGIANRTLLESTRGVNPTLEHIASIPLSQVVQVFHETRAKSPGSFFQDFREVKKTPAELARMTAEQRHDYVHVREHLLEQRAKMERK